MSLNKEIKVGLLATSALLIIYLGANFLKGKEIFAKTNTYYVVYDHAKGLNTSGRVTLNGCPVGMVQSIDLLADTCYQVLVTLSINKDIPLTDQSIAKQVSTNLLGNRGIELLMEQGKILHNRDTLQGQLEQDFQETFIESTLPTLSDAKSITLLTNQFMHNLVDNTARINRIFANLETASKQMQNMLTLNEKELSMIVKNMVEISQAFSDQEIGIRPLLYKIHQLSDELQAKKLSNLFTKMDIILDKMGNTTIPSNLNQMLLSLDNLLVDLRTSPNRYMHFSIFGRHSIFSKKRTQPIKSPKH